MFKKIVCKFIRTKWWFHKEKFKIRWGKRTEKKNKSCESNGSCVLLWIDMPSAKRVHKTTDWVTNWLYVVSVTCVYIVNAPADKTAARNVSTNFSAFLKTISNRSKIGFIVQKGIRRNKSYILQLKNPIVMPGLTIIPWHNFLHFIPFRNVQKE